MYLSGIDVVVCTKSNCHNGFDEVLLKVFFFISASSYNKLGADCGN